MNPRLAYDLERAGPGLVAGADEAGRGSLAGPLVAAAVLFDYACWSDDDFGDLADLDDSKRLSRRRREAVCGRVLRRARQVTVVSCAPQSIDGRGLQACNVGALERALALLSPTPRLAFVDGFPLKGSAVAHEALVGGDGRSAAVAAASVVAKVTRDRLMARLDERFPQWGFVRHVGYASEEHRRAIVEHGVCELHRLSFDSVAYRQLDLRL
jgi:ribonuclease HII